MTDGWRTVRIGDWGEVRGGRQRSPHLTRGTMRPYLRVANVFDGRIDTSDVLEMPFTDAEFAQYALRPGDILLNEGQSSALVGRSAIYDGPPDTYAFQNTLLRFRAGPACNPVFAQELFRDLWDQGVFESLSKKTTSIAHLGLTRFANLAVRVPPVTVQQSFARPLHRLTAVITDVARLIEAKAYRRQLIAERMFTGRLRFHSFGEPALRALPRDWCDVRLVEHSSDLSTRNRAGWGPERVQGVFKGTGLAPMRDHVRAADLSRYKVLPADGFAYNPMRLNIGSIARNTLGADCLVSPDYVVFQTNPATLAPRYLDQLRCYSAWQRFVTPAGSGSVRVRIYFRDLAKMRIALPPIEEQHRIADTLELLDREIALLGQLRDAYAEQKRGLMQRLLAGDVALPTAPAPAAPLAHA